MKLCLGLLFLIFIFSVNAAISREKRRELSIKSMTECRLKENGTEDDFREIITTMHATTQKGHCMIACGYVFIFKRRKKTRDNFSLIETGLKILRL